MRVSDVYVVLALAFTASTSPLTSRDEATAAKNKQEISDYLARRNANLQIVKTTISPEGQTIDWIPIESQGDIPSPPPLLANVEQDSTRPDTRAVTELQDPSAQTGPPGTVPVLRPNFDGIDYSKTSLSDLLYKPGFGLSQPAKEKRDNLDWHKEAMVARFGDNFGGQGLFSASNPATEQKDFSLIQTAVARLNGAAHPPSDGALTSSQTVEAGLIVHPNKFNDKKTHIFAFFNTNGYAKSGDFIKAWNTEYKGWVQVDKQIFPGTALSSTSVVGGKQFFVDITYELFQGNWWLNVMGRWIGFYPAHMFSDNRQNAAETLADHSDVLTYYGEVLDNPDDPAVTTTDMGSGQFPGTHWPKSAYIRNILWQADRRPKQNAPVTMKAFDGGVNTLTDPTRWDIESHTSASPSGSWGSYVWLGGPGRTT